MWWLFFILFFLISVVSSTLLFFSLRRINQYENMLINFERIIKFSSEKMKQVDANGHYESDDETGFFFEQMKAIQKLLDEIFIKDSEKDSDKEIEENTDG